MPKKSRRKPSKTSLRKRIANDFSDTTKEEALVRSRRCCCVCKEFAGRLTNVHHIIQKANGGSNDIDNAIVLCLRCHGEAGHYNPRHPTGNKYSPSELRRHRHEWWAWCAENPYSPLPKEPIEVTPWQINLPSDGFQTRMLVRVHNKSDRIIHEVILKLFCDSPAIDLKQITLEVLDPKSESRIDNVIPGTGLNTTVIRTDAIDATGSQAIFLRIDSIEPHQILRVLLLDRNPSHVDATLTITVSYFSFEPPPVLERDGGIFIRKYAPESYTIVQEAVMSYRLS